MRGRIRTAAGVVLLLAATASFVLFLRVFLRVGLPRWEEAPKGSVYVWVLTITIPLPLTVGVALLLGVRSWRRFAGWWLLAAAVIAAGTLRWFLPTCQMSLETSVAAFGVCVVLPILGGLFLLVRPSR